MGGGSIPSHADIRVDGKPSALARSRKSSQWRTREDAACKSGIVCGVCHVFYICSTTKTGLRHSERARHSSGPPSYLASFEERAKGLPTFQPLDRTRSPVSMASFKPLKARTPAPIALLRPMPAHHAHAQAVAHACSSGGAVSLRAK